MTAHHRPAHLAKAVVAAGTAGARRSQAAPAVSAAAADSHAFAQACLSGALPAQVLVVGCVVVSLGMIPSTPRPRTPGGEEMSLLVF